jgi:hypothetical protein
MDNINSVSMKVFPCCSFLFNAFLQCFCLDIMLVDAVYLSHCKLLDCTSWSFPPSLFPYLLFLHRCGVLHYNLLFFFPSFPLLLTFSNSPTFGYMFCIYFYVYIIFVFVLGLYSTYEITQYKTTIWYTKTTSRNIPKGM